MTKSNKKNKRVLVLSHDKVGDTMAGPGIRYHYVAEVLSKDFDVTLGVFNPKHVEKHSRHTYKTRHVDVHNFHKAFEEHDFIFTLWLSNDMLAYANRHKKIIIFDVYCPVPVENLVSKLFSGKRLGEIDDAEFTATIARYRDYFEYGDFFIFSNERQRDFWTGFIFGSGLVTPRGYLKDGFYDHLAIAPMGIDLSAKLEHRRNVIRGKMGNISQDDLVIVWTGGIWDWFDAQTVVRAMAMIEKDHPEVKLVFLGTKHPNDEVPAMAETEHTRSLASQLGLLNKTVYFRDGWIDYADRIDYLLEADAAIYAHKPSIEARFSHRTRVLDHILTSLPTIATTGDYFADEVSKQGIGLTVSTENAAALASAILELKNPQLREQFALNFERLKPSYSWEHLLTPLVNYIDTTDPAAKIPKSEIRPLMKPILYRAARRVLPHRIKQIILKMTHLVR
jgi:glycosyltransferase involved in cell wall biosynthesis